VDSRPKAFQSLRGTIRLEQADYHCGRVGWHAQHGRGPNSPALTPVEDAGRATRPELNSGADIRSPETQPESTGGRSKSLNRVFG